ncbi:MAG: hypothetical protein GX858_02555 [Clostridiales bacterium]|nr:hypothetical protein [Clostridiales bacterium]
MNRLTTKNPEGDIKTQASPEDILARLCAYEDWAQGLLAQLHRADTQLEALKAQGRTKTVSFRQILGERLMLRSMVERMPGGKEG